MLEHHAVFLQLHPNATVTPSVLIVMMATVWYHGEVEGIDSLTISDPNIDTSRIFLNYCPPDLTENVHNMAENLATIIPEELIDSVTAIKNVKRQDRHLIIASLPEHVNAEVPHVEVLHRI